MNNESINPSAAPTPPPATPMNTDPIAFTPEPIASTPPKKSKLPLIIIAIIGAIIVAGGVFGVLWYINYQKPERVVLDAMTNLFNAETIELEGTVDIDFNKSNDLGISAIKFHLDTKSSILPSSFDSSLTFFTEDDDEVSVYFNTIVLADGSIYLEIKSLTEALTAALPDELAPILDYFEEELDELDGQWYEFDIIELANTLGAEIDTNQFDCVIEAANALNDSSTRNALIDAFTNNPFIVAEPTNKTKNGGNGYTIELDSKKAETFATDLEQNGVFDNFKACGDTEEATTHGLDITPIVEDVAPIIEDADLPEFVFFISAWKHELTGIDINYENEDITLAASFRIYFPDQVEISAPSGAKSATTLIEKVMEKLLTQLMAEDEEELPAETPNPAE